MRYSVLLVLCVNFVYSQNWQNVGQPGFSSGAVKYNTVIKSDATGTLFVAYQDAANNNAATVAKYNGSSWTTVGSAGFSNPDIGFLDLALSSTGIPFVFYSDASSGQGTVKKFNGSAWVNVGNAQFTPSTAVSPCIAISSSGIPYVAFADYSNGLKSRVMKFDGTNWVDVGSNSWNGVAQWIDIAIDKNDVPIIAYQEGAGGPIRVKKITTGTWTTFGSQTFPSSTAEFLSLVISPNNTPFVCFSSDIGFSIPTVFKYNGSSWTQIGGYFNGGNMCFYPELAVDNQDNPFIAYRNNNQPPDKTATVRVFNGTDWILVGVEEVSEGFIGGLPSQGNSKTSLSICLDNAGKPMISFADYSNNRSGKVTVKSYNSPLCIGCVWPGDADNNGVVDNFDLLPVSVGFGKTGSIRPSASSQWFAQKSLDWSSAYQNLINYKYADTDGSGLINNSDVNAINLNWSQIHSKTDEQRGINGAPFIYSKIVNYTIRAKDTVTIEVWVGDSIQNILDAYAFAFDLKLNQDIIDMNSVQILYKDNWLDTITNLVSCSKIDTNLGKLYLAIGKTNQQSKSGFGKIATVKAVAKSKISGVGIMSDLCVVSRNNSVNSFGEELTLNSVTDSVLIDGAPSSIEEGVTSKIKIYPSPAKDILLVENIPLHTHLVITNILGETVWEQVVDSEHLAIGIAYLPSGMYFLDRRKIVKQ